MKLQEHISLVWNTRPAVWYQYTVNNISFYAFQFISDTLFDSKSGFTIPFLLLFVLSLRADKWHATLIVFL